MRSSQGKRAVLRTAGLVTAALVVLMLLTRFVAGPMHAAGIAQPLLAPANALGHLLGAPGAYLAARHMTAEYRRRSVRSFLVALGWNSVFYFTGSSLVAILCKRRKSQIRPSKPRASDPGDRFSSTDPSQRGRAQSQDTISRRAFLVHSARKTAAIGSLTAVTGTGAYSLLVEPNFLPVTFNSFALPGLPKELDRLRVVHLTDVHHGPWLSLAFVERVIERTNSLRPDLVLITGDHVVAEDHYIAPVASAFAKLRPRFGTLSTLGNHDWWCGAGRVRDAFRRNGLPLIDNTRCFLLKDGTMTDNLPASAAGICLAGLGDLWEDGADFQAALGSVPPEMPRLLLSHNPDAAESPDLRKCGERIDLMFCGHTHGGQIRIPVLGTPVVPSQYGQKYASGLVQGPHCPVYVSRGIGLTVLPLRLGVPPEIAVFEFRSV